MTALARTRSRRALAGTVLVALLVVAPSLARAGEDDDAPSQTRTGERSSRAHSSDSWDDTRDGRATRSYVLRRGTDWHGSGEGDDWHEAKDVARRIEEPFVLFRRDGRLWLATDPALLAELERIVEPQRELGRRQRELGRQQRVLGREQSRLGRRQGELGRMQADLARQQGEISRSGALRTARGPSDDLRELMREVEQMQREIGRRQSALGAQQGELGGRQSELGARQAELGRQQREASRRAWAAIDDLTARAIESGIAKRHDD